MQLKRNYLIEWGFQYSNKILCKYHDYMTNIEPNITLLKKQKLPMLVIPYNLTDILDIDLSMLIKYGSIKEEINPSESSYNKLRFKKKSGGYRYIKAPNDALKSIQRSIYDKILLKVKASRFATGFVPAKSNVKNAELHKGFKVIYILDFKNFFPNIKFNQVFNVFRQRLGYSSAISMILTSLTTYAPRSLSNGKLVLLNEMEGLLPQGAPTSPYISNLVCAELDYELYKFARKSKFEYSRYADDITLSSSLRSTVPKQFRSEIREKIKSFGFHINYKKEFISRKKHRITGIIAHEDQLAVPRRWKKNLRAALWELKVINCEKTHPNYLLHLLNNVQGRINYIIGVNSRKYRHFYEEFQELKNSKFLYLIKKKNHTNN